MKNDTTPDRKMNDFEVTNSYLLIYGPLYNQKDAGTKRSVVWVFNTSGSDVSYT